MLTLALIAIIGIAGIAAANTFSAEGGLLEPARGYVTIAERDVLVNDGDFEGGSCLTAPIWTCTTDNGCDWITDLSDHLLGYQVEYADITGFGGVHTLCFNYDLQVAGDNYFVDFVENFGVWSATEDASFSTVKALY